MGRVGNCFIKRMIALFLSGTLIVSNIPGVNRISQDVTVYAAEYDLNTEEEYCEIDSRDNDCEINETEETHVRRTSVADTMEENEEIIADVVEDEIIESQKDCADEERTTEKAEDESATEVDNNTATDSRNCVTLSDGLKAGTKYGDEILTFRVLQDMLYNTDEITVDEITYSGYVMGDSVPKVGGQFGDIAGEECFIPDYGSAFQIEATKAAKITFMLGFPMGRDYYFTKDDHTVMGEILESNLLNKIGTHTFNLDPGNTYYFFVKNSKPQVYDISWEERDLADEMNRPQWETIEKPVISNIAIDDTDKTTVKVTVDALIGKTGADKVTVSMYDEEGNKLKSTESVEEKATTVFSFSLNATGNYTFQAAVSRKDEERIIESEISKPFSFKFPLTVPVFRAATSLGDGQIELKWKAVNEAGKYVVEITGDKPFEPRACTGFSTVIEDLTIGQEYSFTIYAMRGEEKTEKSQPKTIVATSEKNFNWDFSSYGKSTIDGRNRLEIKEDKSVRIEASSGKIVPHENDGLAFYYTTIDPRTTNFTFKATAHVNSWKYSNGQEGFGIMAADSIGEDGDSKDFWNNSYQAVVSRINYGWNGSEATADGIGEKIRMCLGVGATEKIGVTPGDVSKISEGELTIPVNFRATQETLDTTHAKYGAGQYNMVGNCVVGSNLLQGNDHEHYVNFKFQLQKNNTGYFVSYTQLDDDGNVILDSNGSPITITRKYYDTKALNVLEEDLVYVGVFASRNADVTFTDMEFTTISPEEDEPAETEPVKYVNSSYKILSENVTNTENYQFVFESNWNGRLVLKDSEGNILTKHTERDTDGKEVELDYYNVGGTLDPAVSKLLKGNEEKNTKIYVDVDGLTVGNNVLMVEFTPDKEWSPQISSLIKLKNYDKWTKNYTITYKKYGKQGQTIYVSQEGKPGNAGTKEKPLDIYSAVRHAQPGQTILLAGGRYDLSQTIYIPRGIDGEPQKAGDKEAYNQYIRMMAADSKNRPVFDFHGQAAGMIACGDYWYFKDFDVTGSKDCEYGIQVSGSHCVFDRVDTYKNGYVGLCICCAREEDTYRDWPSDNLILNCNSYLNADTQRENADGFGAKCTNGSGNVFDGCIAAYNVGDGWDLFADNKIGNTGAVTLKNCIAYKNGYLLLDENNRPDENGAAREANGTAIGFNMGGCGLAGGSIYDADYDSNAVVPYSGNKIMNSLAFYNLFEGVDSSSNYNLKVYGSVFYNNGGEGISNRTAGSNIVLSTYDINRDTDYELKNVISFRTDGYAFVDSISGKGKQKVDKIINDTMYYWDADENAAVNAEKGQIKADDFISLRYDGLDRIDKAYWRNTDGTINMHDFLVLKEGISTDAATGMRPAVGGTASNNPAIGEDTDGTITGDIGPEVPPETSEPEESESISETSEPEESETISESSEPEESETISETSEQEETESTLETNEPEESESMPESGETGESEPETGESEESESEPESSETGETESPHDSGIWIVGLDTSYPYTGSKITPDFEVWDYDMEHGRNLIQGVDYTVSYKNNSKIGTASVIVSGKGNYTGKDVMENFLIKEADYVVESVDVKGAKIEKIADTQYTGERQYPDFTLVLKNGSLVTYVKNDNFSENKNPYKRKDGAPMDINVAVSNNVKKGTAVILVTGAKDAKGRATSVKKTFKITAVDLSRADVEIKVQEADYAVKGAMPAVTVCYKGKTLISGKDFTAKYGNNKKVGTGTVTITGKGNYTKKCNPKQYSIQPLDLSEISVDAITACEGIKAGKVKAVVTDKNGTALKASQYTLKLYQVRENEGTEVVGTEYTKNDVLANGKVYVQVEAKDIQNLKGKTNITKEKALFQVGKDISKAKFTLVEKSKQYTGSEIKLQATDLNGTINGVSGILEMGKDYEIVAYTNNTDKGTATAILKGIGYYSGTKAVKFKIVQKVMTKGKKTSG